MSDVIPWVIFDADNTLWAVEKLYDDARTELCAFLAVKGIPADRAENVQQWRDKELHATYGYSACRFARSFEDTLLAFFPNADSRDIRHVRQLALRVFEQRAETESGLDDSLASAAASGYNLAIITAGERWVQERRLDDFHLRHLFQVVEIVEQKDASTFSNFCDRHHVDRRRSWVVGDSFNSDIRPARQAGLNAIWVTSANWHLVEGRVSEEFPEVPRISTLADLVHVLPSSESTNGSGSSSAS